MTRLAFQVAQHEAAHVVVGVALGLRLREATARPSPARNGEPAMAGYAWFHESRGQGEAVAIMFAAGIAWENAVGGEGAWFDRRLIRERGFGRHAERAFIRSAAALIESLSSVHARVTRALLERDLTAADITAIARGEALPVAE